MELKDAVNIYNHICDNFVDDCSGCPFSEANVKCCNPFDNKLDEEEIVRWENIADEWQKNHKAIYPTYRDLIHYIMDHTNDLNKPISEEFAEEFNIMPINECGLTKYERGEWTP